MEHTIQTFLENLPGVIGVSPVPDTEKAAIVENEKLNEKHQLVGLINIGVRQAAAREHLYVVIKTSRFRPPPCPTIYLVEEAAEAAGTSSAERLEIDGKQYRIVGEEVMDSSKTYEEKHVFFQKGFVLFPDRRAGKSHVPAYFLIPAIPFPELENRKQELSIRNVISVSPSTPCDEYLRKRFDLDPAPEYATILVGFDTIHPGC